MTQWIHISYQIPIILLYTLCCTTTWCRGKSSICYTGIPVSFSLCQWVCIMQLSCLALGKCSLRTFTLHSETHCHTGNTEVSTKPKFFICNVLFILCSTKPNYLDLASMVSFKLFNMSLHLPVLSLSGDEEM